MLIEYSARSHVGKVRDGNEDNLFVNGAFMPLHARNRPVSIDGVGEEPCVFAVCDGMGGEDYGEIASHIAVEKLGQFQERLCLSAEGQLEKTVRDYVREADWAIREAVGPGKNAGTTLALSVIVNRNVYCFNMGDSRIYAVKNGVLRQITNDHTWMAEKMEFTRPLTGEMIRENFHKITRCMGIGPGPNVDVYPPFGGRCRLFICSDGMTDMASNAELEEVLTRDISASHAADRLLSLVLDKGGYDNVTLIVVDTPSPRRREAGKLF